MTTYVTTIAKTHSINVDWDKMPANAKEKIIAYGVQRVFNDMVGGSERFPTIKDKVDHVEHMLARFYAGDIGRAVSAGVSTETAVGRALVRQALKAKYGAKSPEWANFTGLSDAAQDEKLDALFAANKEKLAPQVAAEIKRRAAIADQRKKQADGLELAL